MRKLTRVVVLLISLALIVSYFVPMWGIYLDAPQYPEGLGMQIWLNKMSGDLNTINGLNHYIGMKKIYPDSIPELKIMPYLIGVLIAGALAIFFTKKKWIFMTWALFFVAIGIYGMYDFYTWEYDYGHNLDPHAAIKVPGMNYQPPLLGSKQLLNFKAYSLPDIGGFLIMGSAILAFLFLLVELKKVKSLSAVQKIDLNKKSKSESKSGSMSESKISKVVSGIFIFFLLASLTSCNVESQPIKYGKDICSFCKMQISDQKFASEIVTKKGKVYKFDSIECMINYISKNHVEEFTINSLLTNDYVAPEKFIDAKSAYFSISPEFKSPMGGNIAAFREKLSAQKFGENILTWQQAFKNIIEKK